MKGAPEFVLPLCKTQLDTRGDEVNLSNEERENILNNEIINNFCKKGLRAIVYGYKDFKTYEWEDLKASYNNFILETDRIILERDFTFVAAFALNDELRDGVRDSILKLKDGQLNIRMISGDNLQTAIEVAKRAGILNDGEERTDKAVMEGTEFREFVGGYRITKDKDGNEKYSIVNQ